MRSLPKVAGRIITTILLVLMILLAAPASAQDRDTPSTPDPPPPVSDQPAPPLELTLPPQCVIGVVADEHATAAAVARSRRLAAAHQLADGSGIRVAVIDTGVAHHPGLPTLQDGKDYIDDGVDSAFLDCDAHGTLVAGIIAGLYRLPESNHTVAITGVAPAAEVRTYRQTSATATPGKPAGTLVTLAAAITEAVVAGAHVINISVVSCVPPDRAGLVDIQPLHDALALAEEHNVVVVSASGNAGGACQPDAVVFPAHLPTVVSVEAVDHSGDITDYSLPGVYPRVSGPGWVPAGFAPTGDGLILSTGSMANPAPLNGTSFAAPWVSGTVALMLQRNPGLRAADIRRLLVESTDPTTGYIDPYQAVSYLSANTPQPRELAITVPEPQPDTLLQRSFFALGGVAILPAGWTLWQAGRRKRHSTPPESTRTTSTT